MSASEAALPNRGVGVSRAYPGDHACRRPDCGGDLCFVSRISRYAGVLGPVQAAESARSFRGSGDALGMITVTLQAELAMQEVRAGAE